MDDTRKSVCTKKYAEKYNINHFKALHKNRIIQFVTNTHNTLECCIVNGMQHAILTL